MFIFYYETTNAQNLITVERLNEGTFYNHPESLKIKRETLFILNLNISDIPIRCKLCQIIK